MDDNEDDKDGKVTRFPDEKERRTRIILRAANDGARKDEPALNLPPAAKFLCVSMTLIYLVEWALPFFIGEERTDSLIYALGLVVTRYTGGQAPGLAAFTSPVTHMFVHGGWVHLGINVMSLMAFGAGVEKWMGPRRMLLIFFLTGLIGALGQCLVAPHLDSPLIGASGAISGLFGALIVQMNDRGVLAANGRNPLLIFAVMWVATALFFGFFGVPGAPGAISWATHIGGFVAGMALARPVARLKI
jgi:membrane associated rhomboid family serine protease